LKRILASWSSGKDSAWMIHVLRHTPGVEVAALLTTVNEVANRVAMHAVRVDVLQAQADALGLPLWQIPIPSPCPNDVYERAMAAAVARAVADGFTHVSFGDLFLEDIRRYREEKLAGTGLTPLFPLFGSDTRGAGAGNGGRGARRSNHLPESEGHGSKVRPAVNSTNRCSTNCRSRSTRAPSAASSIPVHIAGRCSAVRCRSVRASRSSGTATYSPTSRSTDNYHMTCGHCGGANFAWASRCDHCGRDLPHSALPADASVQAPAGLTEATPSILRPNESAILRQRCTERYPRYRCRRFSSS
jgi:hypothetical protein